MKKLFIFSVLAVAVIGFSACGGSKKSSEAEILEFWVSDQKFDKTGTNFYRLFEKDGENQWKGGYIRGGQNVPSKVEISKGATISPPITTAQNFETSSGVTYTVTAEDGTQKTFNVKADSQPTM